MKTMLKQAIAVPATAPAPSAWALASLALPMLLAALGTSIANVGLPTLAQAFDASFQDVQWVVLAYLLAVTTLIVGAGRLGDLYGRRRLMLAGIALYTAASLLCGLAPTLGWLVAARAAQGLGAALMMALTLALVAEVVPKDRTGRAMGLLGTMSAIGTALGPSLGGALIAACGWPALFLVNLPLGLAALLLAWQRLPADSARADGATRERFDVAGTLLLALTLAAYALAMTLGRGDFGATNLALLAAALVGLFAFGRVERRAATPLIRLAMFAWPVLGAGFAMSALVTTVVMATLVVGPFYLSGAFALDAARVGLAMSAGPLAAALMGVPAGRLVDRHGTAGTSLAGLIAMAAGAGVLTLLPTRLGVAGYLAPLVLITAGYALFQTANNTAVMGGVAAAQRGVVSALLNLSRNLGLISGASVMGAVFAMAAATTDFATAPVEAVAAGMRATFMVATMMVVVAIMVAIGSRAPRQTTVTSKATPCGRPGG
ncbi:MAG: MFS transporter [Betaproteobacteria bacterium]|nr:MFS transporter [Betaproteobacteria bacterium]